MSWKIPDYGALIPKPNMHPIYEAVRTRAQLKNHRHLSDERVKAHDRCDYALFWSLFAPNVVLEWKLQLAVEWYCWICKFVDVHVRERTDVSSQLHEFRHACYHDDGGTGEGDLRLQLHEHIGGVEAVITGGDPPPDLPEQWATICHMYKSIRSQLVLSSDTGMYVQRSDAT